MRARVTVTLVNTDVRRKFADFLENLTKLSSFPTLKCEKVGSSRTQPLQQSVGRRPPQTILRSKEYLACRSTVNGNPNKIDKGEIRYGKTNPSRSSQPKRWLGR